MNTSTPFTNKSYKFGDGSDYQIRPIQADDRERMNSENSILILIDLQGRLMPAIDQGEAVLKQCIRTAQIAQLLEIPIISTEQSSSSLGSNLNSIQSFCSKTIQKEYFNACADGLIAAIPDTRQQCILMGCETHVCLMQTALDRLSTA